MNELLSLRKDGEIPERVARILKETHVILASKIRRQQELREEYRLCKARQARFPFELQAELTDLNAQIDSLGARREGCETLHKIFQRSFNLREL